MFKAYDSSGTALSWSAFRSLESNGAGSNGYNDALLDPATFQITAGSPLFQQGSGIAFERPAGASVLALAWPSLDGYSQLLIPTPRAGTYNFNLLAAETAAANLAALQASHPGIAPAGAAATASTAAAADLKTAHGATSDSAVGAAAAKAYEEAVHAQVLLQQQYGTAAASSSTSAHAVTVDDIPTTAQLQAIRNVTGPGGWVRFVLDPGTNFSDYSPALATAHSLGLKVLGQPVDSSEMKGMSDSAWQSRWQAALTTLPSVDSWETGNEINGNWLGSNVAARVTWANSFVKNKGGHTFVTLYWELGEDSAAYGTFNWLAAHRSTVAQADQVGISLYPEMDPLGVALLPVMAQLHAQLPDTPLLISELGYGGPDLQHTWWWGSATDTAGAGRAAVAGYYTASMGVLPFSGGAPYWWYWLEDGKSGTPLVSTLQALWN